MAGEDNQESQGQDKIQQFFSTYKFPLIFGSAGLIFITGAAIVIIRQNTQSANVVFITQATESAKLKIKIDVEGAVMTPGVYELEEGSRISDALTAAGGFSASADRQYVEKNINRAVRLKDGGKIYIPAVSESSSYPSDLGDLSVSSSVKTVNINTSSQAELEFLPGVGPVTAVKIISARPYQIVEELKTKKIVGDSVFEKIKDKISL